jgi:hypothetical protein
VRAEIVAYSESSRSRESTFKVPATTSVDTCTPPMSSYPVELKPSARRDGRAWSALTSHTLRQVVRALCSCAGCLHAILQSSPIYSSIPASPLPHTLTGERMVCGSTLQPDSSVLSSQNPDTRILTCAVILCSTNPLHCDASRTRTTIHSQLTQQIHRSILVRTHRP